LGPTSAPEVIGAVADFDSASPAPEQQARTYAVESQPEHHSPQPEVTTTSIQAGEETAQESDKAARRRSTVREKVSFLPEAAPESPVVQSESQEPAPAQQDPSAPESADNSAPRRAGWWSRRFGNGS
jgi:ribonuclease E